MYVEWLGFLGFIFWFYIFQMKVNPGNMKTDNN